jgi:hypothetical protein
LLPIAYARFGISCLFFFAPQLNLSLLAANNQNLTANQKLLLHWQHCFGHLNLPALQHILRSVPFPTFAAASKYDSHVICCAICKYAKGHCCPKHSTLQVLKSDCDDAFKIKHLKPGLQMSVDHFESCLAF